jgi:hypothetical protein
MRHAGDNIHATPHPERRRTFEACRPQHRLSDAPTSSFSTADWGTRAHADYSPLKGAITRDKGQTIVRLTRQFVVSLFAGGADLHGFVVLGGDEEDAA